MRKKQPSQGGQKEIGVSKETVNREEIATEKEIESLEGRKVVSRKEEEIRRDLVREVMIRRTRTGSLKRMRGINNERKVTEGQEAVQDRTTMIVDLVSNQFHTATSRGDIMN